MEKEYIVKVCDDLVINAFERFESEWSAEELVRCGECKYGEYVCSGVYECRSPAAVKKFYAQFHKGEWFCADGERKGAGFR